jgi:hypothetical protein
MTRRDTGDPGDGQIQELREQLAGQAARIEELAEEMENLREDACTLRTFDEMRIRNAMARGPVLASARRRDHLRIVKN